ARRPEVPLALGFALDGQGVVAEEPEGELELFRTVKHHRGAGLPALVDHVRPTSRPGDPAPALSAGAADLRADLDVIGPRPLGAGLDFEGHLLTTEQRGEVV